MTEIAVNAAGADAGGAATTALSGPEVVQWILTAGLTVNERVLIVRALRDSFPELVPVDPRLAGRIRVAQATSPDFIETTVNGLENYEVWQQSASASPKELRRHREYKDEQRPMIDALQAFVDILQYNVRYQHFLGVEKARTAFKIGKEMSGEAGLSIKPHLEIIALTRPNGGRRRKKAVVAPTPTPTPTPAPTPAPVVAPK